jgi:succinate-semialdehyde dehydrogenase/glutarate-semialdehyde dehydrogenase
MLLTTTNPATGKLVRTFPELTAAEIDARLNAARSAFLEYHRCPSAHRAEKLTRLAELFDAAQDELAHLAALEMGKPLAQGRAEAAKCADGCRYYAEHGPALLRDERIDDLSFVRHDPLGVVLALMPWNFPFWQVVRCAVPALLAGNVVLLKHADNTPQCGARLEELFHNAGFEPGCFQYLAVPVAGVQALIEDSRIDAVSLTGSVEAGRQVAAAAGARIKPVVLELGGSDPFIILPSADLRKAVAAALQSRTQNAGQSCIAAKRIIVHEAVYDQVAAALAAAFRALRVGDPLDLGTDVGPIARARGLESLERQVTEAIRAGARVLAGGRRLDRPGFFFEPTLLAGLPPESPLAREEIFGPVALLFRARDLEHALVLANDTPFGLAASVWTNEPGEQERAIAAIEAGQVFVNAMVASAAELPFGGIKQSGYGRELGAPGLRAFVNAKSVRFGAFGKS